MLALKLPEAYRIRQKVDFDVVFKHRKRLSNRYLLAYYHNGQLSHPRIGVITSKRNIKLAVDRNRIRRVLKEQFRLNQHKLPPWDIVIVTQKGIGQYENKELRLCCSELFNRLSALFKKP